MDITDVSVKLVENQDTRLKAFCLITFDNEFVVRDVKVIEGTGGYFVAMPSRKTSYHCERCGCKNHVRARFCNECGAKLPEQHVRKTSKGLPKLHADIAHPITSACRKKVRQAVLDAFKAEMEVSADAGYAAREYADAEEVPEVIS